MPRAVVVGAGIGGLCAAIGLRGIGWDVEVHERATAVEDVGAGITLWPNAVRGLRALGVDEELRALATVPDSGGVREPGGRWLSHWDGPMFSARLDDPMIAVHRATLIRILRDALPDSVLHNGSDVTETPEADLVVAADGINSTLRGRLFPAHPGTAYSGVTALRAVVAPVEPRFLGETWGNGTEFGVVPIVDGRVYWFAALSLPANTKLDRDDVLRRFGDWHAPIGELIATTPWDSVLRHDIHVLARPLRSFVGGRVALVGDAAHAMTPFLGQGGCQAIEDAVVLAASLARSPVPQGLRVYDTVRVRRANSVARLSWLMGKLGPQLAIRPIIAARNAVLRAVPTSVTARGMARVADWTPPPLA